MDSLNNVYKVTLYWQLHMRHEASSLFRRDTWLQYVHSYLQNYPLSLFLSIANFLHNYIYTIRDHRR